MDQQCHLLEQTFLRELIKKVINFVKVNLIIMTTTTSLFYYGIKTLQQYSQNYFNTKQLYEN